MANRNVSIFMRPLQEKSAFFPHFYGVFVQRGGGDGPETRRAGGMTDDVILCTYNRTLPSLRGRAHTPRVGRAGRAGRDAHAGPARRRLPWPERRYCFHSRGRGGGPGRRGVLSRVRAQRAQLLPAAEPRRGTRGGRGGRWAAWSGPMSARCQATQAGDSQPGCPGSEEGTPGRSDRASRLPPQRGSAGRPGRPPPFATMAHQAGTMPADASWSTMRPPLTAGYGWQPPRAAAGL
jgi:hypothetical protein